MRKVVYSDSSEVAAEAAKDAIAVLSRAIHDSGKAVWALAGGSSPMAAYRELAEGYGKAIDWSKVTMLIGDERCVPLYHEDSNWGQISKILFANENIDAANKLVPQAELGPEEGAKHYSDLISGLSDEKSPLQIDLLWVGVGEDGHTLSLFPGNPALDDDTDTVVPVRNSPKPPADRISLSLTTATAAKRLVIFATGAAKQEALARVELDPESLPVGMVAHQASQAWAEVLWMYDEAAASE